jgi:hypothetical protein
VLTGVTVRESPSGNSRSMSLRSAAGRNDRVPDPLLSCHHKAWTTNLGVVWRDGKPTGSRSRAHGPVEGACRTPITISLFSEDLIGDVSLPMGANYIDHCFARSLRIHRRVQDSGPGSSFLIRKLEAVSRGEGPPGVCPSGVTSLVIGGCSAWRQEPSHERLGAFENLGRPGDPRGPFPCVYRKPYSY